MAKGKIKHINQQVGVIPKSYRQLPTRPAAMHGDQQCGRPGSSQKVVENEIKSRELRGCRMPSMRPHTLHTPFATYRVFFFPLNLYGSSGRRWN